MGIEQKINQKLNRYPMIKKQIKSIYQHAMYVMSPKIKSEGNIVCVSPDDPKHEYFFGYYDKSPWDFSDRYMLCLKANNTWSEVAPKEAAKILIIDTVHNNKAYEIAETHSWNVQQGCMLQWLGSEYKIIYNDFRNNKYCSVILTLDMKENDIKIIKENVIEMPVYTISQDGKIALTLDFSRLHRLRPGYGYSNKEEITKNEKLPDETCIWRIDLISGDIIPLLKYTDFSNFEPRIEMKNAEHKVNHLMLNQSGKRFMVLHRWFNGQHKYSRLITCDIDGTNMYNLSDDDMVSHCCWKNENEILAFENKKNSGIGYYLMKDKTKHSQKYWDGIDFDGHPSFSPNKNMVIFDRYPDKSRVANIMISSANNIEKDSVRTIARVFAPFKYDNDTRCDLHPRWSRDGNKICFDSTFEGHRGLYTVDIARYFERNNDNKKIKDDFELVKFSIITPMYNSFDLMSKYFQSLKKQTYKNFEIIIIDDCSTDHSYNKLKEYVNKSELNIVVAKSDQNEGPGNARNIGMSLASGEWMTFIDSDDWVSEYFLEKINDIIRTENTNCIIYDLNVQTKNKKSISRSVYGEHDSGYMNIGECISLVRNHVVGKVYNIHKCREKNIQFPKQRRCEDVAFVCQAIEACGSAFYLKEPLYYYFQRSESLSNNQNLAEEDMVKAYDILHKKLGNKYPNELSAKSIPDLLYGGVLMMSKSSKSNCEIRKYIKDYEKIYPNWYENDIVNSLGRAKYIYLFCIKHKYIGIIKFLTLIHSILLRG